MNELEKVNSVLKGLFPEELNYKHISKEDFSSTYDVCFKISDILDILRYKFLEAGIKEKNIDNYIKSIVEEKSVLSIVFDIARELEKNIIQYESILKTEISYIIKEINNKYSEEEADKFTTAIRNIYNYNNVLNSYMFFGSENMEILLQNNIAQCENFIDIIGAILFRHSIGNRSKYIPSYFDTQKAQEDYSLCKDFVNDDVYRFLSDINTFLSKESLIQYYFDMLRFTKYLSDKRSDNSIMWKIFKGDAFNFDRFVKEKFVRPFTICKPALSNMMRVQDINISTLKWNYWR